MSEVEVEVVEEKTNELIPFQKKEIETLFKEGGSDLVKIIKEKVSEFKPDMTTVKGRKEIASMAMKVARSKTYLDDIGKGIVAEWKEKSKRIDGERKTIREALDLLKEEVRKPLTDWENKEKERVAKLQTKVEEIENHGKPNNPDGTLRTLESLNESMKFLENLKITAKWDEFQEDAEAKIFTSKMVIGNAIKDLQKQEEEKAKLEAERKKLEAEAQKAREEKIAKEAADKARKEAEEKAEKEKQAAQRKIEEEKRLAEIAAFKEKARADKEKADVEAKAAREKAESERKIKEAEERAQNAARMEREKIEAEDKRKEEEEARRAKDQDWKKTVNNEILSAVMDALQGHDEETKESAKRVVIALATGKIPHVKVVY